MISGSLIAIIAIIPALVITIIVVYIIYCYHKKYHRIIKNQPLQWLDMEQRQEETEHKG